MRERISSGRPAGLAVFAAAGLLWSWLLAGQPIRTAAMGVPAPLLTWLTAVWSKSEDMGHGAFLPLISLAVVWMRRDAIRAALGAPDGRGLAVVGAGLFLFWAGLKTEDVRLCLSALIVWTWAVPFALFGAGVARLLVFPCGYLFLSVPIDSLVIYFTVKLRILAAAAAAFLANGFGIATERLGTGLVGGGFNLDVADPCSGLRSIFAMTALAGAYAFFSQKTPLRQWALFLCAVPVAVAANIVRILAIVVVASLFGADKATGFYHDYSGYLVFLVAILLLMELGRLIGRCPLPPAADEPAPPVAGAASPLPVALRPAAFAKAVAVPTLLAAAVLLVRFDPGVALGSLDFLPASLPDRVDGWAGSPLLHCDNEQCGRPYRLTDLIAAGVAPLTADEGGAADGPTQAGWPSISELRPLYGCPACSTGRLYSVSLGERSLPPDTRMRRSEYTDGKRVFTATLVVSGTGRGSLHRPELCLPAQGFVMKRIDPDVVRTPAGFSLAINRMELERTVPGAGPVRMHSVYWFYSAERQTASNAARLFWTAWDRAFRRQATPWVMVILTAAPGTDDPDRLAAFAGVFMDGLKK